MDELLEQAAARYGDDFVAVLARSRVWVNGEPIDGDHPIGDDDEVAVLPPVSGGAVESPLADAPGDEPPLRFRRLTLVPRDDGPHVRRGIAWALATCAVAAAGTTAFAVWFAGVAALASLQATRGWRSRVRGPNVVIAAAGAALLPLAGAFGWWAVGVAIAAVAIAAVVFGLVTSRDSGGSDPVLTLLLALPIGLAAASPVLVRRLGLVEPLVLLAMVWAFDAGYYLVGSGAGAAWEAAAAGAVSLVPVTVGAAVVLVPTFPSAPFVLGGIAAVLAPLGIPAATILIGDGRASAVRRLDSLLLAGPVWASAAMYFLR